MSKIDTQKKEQTVSSSKIEEVATETITQPTKKEEKPIESIPLGAAISIKELEDLIKANFQFYAGRPIDRFEFDAFNSNNRKITILAKNIKNIKEQITLDEERESSLEGLGINSIEDLSSLGKNINNGLIAKGSNKKQNVSYSKSKISLEKGNRYSHKLNINENAIEGLFTIQDETYIRLPMAADGNCMYYSILISDYLESIVKGETPSIVDIRGEPYINVDRTDVFRESLQGRSRNLIVNGALNLDIVARKFKQDLYRSWKYRLDNTFSKNNPTFTLGVGHFFKDREVNINNNKDAAEEKDGSGNSTFITDLLSSTREPTYISQIEGDKNNIDNYFNFVFNDGYSTDEKKLYKENYLLDGDRDINNDEQLIINENKDNKNFGKGLKIWGTITELLFILIRFRNLRIVVYNIDPNMDNQDIITFDLSDYNIDSKSNSTIKTLYLLFTGIHYDVLANTKILDMIN